MLFGCKNAEKTDTIKIDFDRETCINCLKKEECPINIKATKATFPIPVKGIKRAIYSKKIGAKKYNKLRKKRNGVEGIPSLLRNKMLIDRVPVRGRVCLKLWYGLKIGAINSIRVIKWGKKAV